MRHFIRKPTYISIVDNSKKYSVARQQGKGAHSCASVTTFNGFVLLKASCTSTAIQSEYIICLHCCHHENTLLKPQYEFSRKLVQWDLRCYVLTKDRRT